MAMLPPAPPSEPRHPLVSLPISMCRRGPRFHSSPVLGAIIPGLQVAMWSSLPCHEEFSSCVLSFLAEKISAKVAGRRTTTACRMACRVEIDVHRSEDQNSSQFFVKGGRSDFAMWGPVAQNTRLRCGCSIGCVFAKFFNLGVQSEFAEPWAFLEGLH